MLLREAEGPPTAKGAAAGKKGRSQGCGQLAYIDELAGGRVGVVDA